jgi:hypothetical protein
MNVIKNRKRLASERTSTSRETKAGLGAPWFLALFCLPLVMATATLILTATAGPISTNASFQKSRVQGPWADPAFFPLAVWLQSPENAGRYRKAGFNTCVGLWKGPTEQQLAALKGTGMLVICAQNQVALLHLDDPIIIGWMHEDEPDNAQTWAARLGWGKPVSPETVVKDYQRMRMADPSRPVLLNLGQAVAWDGWYGRGSRNHHPEDYPEYVKGCDIASFDIYPVNHDSPEVSGRLWYVAQGVERLMRWGGGEKIIWNCVECTAIRSPKQRPTPHQVRAEAWMSLIHGSRGLIYFVHQFKPVFKEAALLDDSKMLAAVSALNRQITELAPVLNSPTIHNRVTVQSENVNVPIATMVKQCQGSTYLFAVGMRDGPTSATFTFKGIKGEGSLQVLDEDRDVTARDGVFEDTFAPWDVHLYRLPDNAKQ